jgi:N-acetylmuramoyl-L-alanine amidase
VKRILLVLAVLSLVEFHIRANPVVVIDVGHGGKSDSGTDIERTLSSANNATSPDGLKEKDLTLELALEIQRQIHLLSEKDPARGLDCTLTRNTDTNPDFFERASICGAAKPVPQAIISIHFNASQNHKALGTVTMVGDRSHNPNYENDLAFAKELAATIHRVIVPLLPESKAREPISDGHLHQGQGSYFLYQLGKIPSLKSVPKCFLEVEFIDRADSEKALIVPRKETFPVIAKALAVWFLERYGSQYCSR